MANGNQPRGACVYCGRAMTRGGMSRHLRACPERQAAIEVADAQRGRQEKLYHLQVEDAWGGDYWLHLEMRGEATLEALDRYLRAIWLECCGHLSRFSIGGWGGRELPMEARAARILKPDMDEITHIYDFGTSSYTTIKVRDVREGRPTTEYPIALMARNNPPEIECMECDQPAAYLCLECMYEDDEPGTLCQDHEADHPHDDYGAPLPIVNSPRVGLCGYDGPAEPPY